MEISDHHILVTGAARRLGRALAIAFLEIGARVSCHFLHSKKEVEELVEEAQAKKQKAFAVSADLAKTSQILTAVELAKKKWGPIDILVNCASDFFPTPALSCTEQQWDHFANVNLRGQFFFAQACAHDMTIRGGNIINIVDVYAERPLRGYAAYAASKGGLLTLTKTLAKEWAPKVRVNAISPGPVLLPPNYTQEQSERAIERTVLKRLGSPEDVVQAAIFLIGNDYITGFNLKVDGGIL